MISRRQLLQLPLASLPAALSPARTLAQPASFTRSVRLVVAASAGTTVDSVARFVAERLSPSLGVSVFVENRPGSGGAIGSRAVAQAAPDGHTLLITGITHFAALYSGEAAATYDPLNDFTGIARFCSSALAIVVPTNSPYKTMADLLAAMRANPGEIDYGSGGVGSTSHLCTTILTDATNTTAKHIPYRGNTPTVADTVAGVVAFTCQGAGGVLPLIHAGRLRALAVTSRNRWEALPDVPTGIESGIPDFEVFSWIGALAPAGTPANLILQVSDGLAAIARSAAFKAFCDKQSIYVDLAEHDAFQAELPKEDEHWRRVAELLKRS